MQCLNCEKFAGSCTFRPSEPDRNCERAFMGFEVSACDVVHVCVCVCVCSFR